MNIGRGCVFYNQEIPDDEIWEDTLKRENLIIVQVGREAESVLYKGKFNVTIFTTSSDELLIKVDVLSEKEIKKLIK